MHEGSNIEGDKKMTPQKMMEEIQKTYPTSHAFLQEIIEAGNNNWAISRDRNDVRSIVVQLAQYHRSILVHHMYTDGIEDQEKKEKKMYEKGLWLANVVGAVYYGELTMISKDGKLLTKPEPFQKSL